jgi:hypothetical protein
MTSIAHLARQDARPRTPATIVSIPDDVRRFIERQIDELDENERNLLSAASVISREFATAAVAAALEANVEIEVDCARLARQGALSGSSARAPQSRGDPRRGERRDRVSAHELFGWKAEKMALVYTRKADRKRLASTAGQLLLLPTQTENENRSHLRSDAGTRTGPDGGQR